MSVLSKTPAAWLAGVFCACLSGTVGALCPPQGELEAAELAFVHDGDTLRLSDGRRVRMLGIDATELGRDGAEDEPLARQARAAVQAFFADDRVQLAVGERREDHYGRTLAHTYNREGKNLEAYLVRRGLAFALAVPPDMHKAECLRAQEAHARRARLGVWGEFGLPPKQAGQLSLNDAGFALVQGRIEDVSEAGGSVWLELDGPLVLRVHERDRERFADSDWSDWQGRRVEVRGWLVDRSDSRAAQRGYKPMVLALRTPYNLRTFDD